GTGLVLVLLHLAVRAGQRRLPDDVVAVLAAPGQRQVLFVADAHAGRAAPAGPVAGPRGPPREQGRRDGGTEGDTPHLPYSPSVLREPPGRAPPPAGSETRPRRLKLARYSGGGPSARRPGKRRTSVSNTIFPSSRASGAPRQKCGPRPKATCLLSA